jgi:Kelch motif protein/putative pyrroloquinoline-quinone binding quinoprotein
MRADGAPAAAQRDRHTAKAVGVRARRIIRAIAWPSIPHRRTSAALALLVVWTLGACSTATPASHATAPPSGTAFAPAASSASPAPVVLAVRRAAYRLTAPVQRAVAVAGPGGAAVYVLGGLDAAGASAGGVFRLDPLTGTLSAVGSVPSAFHDAAAAVLGGRILVFGGGASSGTDLVQSVDIATGSASIAGHLPEPLSDLTAATVTTGPGAGIYLVGGWDGSTASRTIWRTVDGRRFTAVGRLPIGLRYASAAAVGPTIVVAGGQVNDRPVADVFAFDTTTGRVRRLPDLPGPIGHAAAFAVAGEAYVLGGIDAAGRAVSTVTAIDPAAGTVVPEAPLPAAVSDAAVAPMADGAVLVGGWRDGHAVDQVLIATTAAARAPSDATATTPLAANAERAAASVRPFAGLLLVADRGNDRLLVLDADRRVVWSYPSPDLPAPPVPFYFPDDAFWVHGGRAILVNEEENDVLTEIAYPSGRTLWTYGHPRTPGSSVGYVHQPDDLYPYPGGGMVVADASNCRILFFGPAGQPTGQIGTTGDCTPGLPATVGYPNASTPLPNGHLLVTELHAGAIAEVTRTGHPVWRVQIPALSVPSDPQPLPDGTFLAVDFAAPGAVVRFTRTGKVLWEYRPTSGPGELDHPSLGAPLPNGLIAVNDDYNDRVVLIDPKRDRIVWQYGVTNVAGTGHGHLRYPDGLDLLLPGHDVPLHVDFPSSRVRAGRP